MSEAFYTWEHEDGRVAVATAPAAFAEGDPKWHRGVPCEVHLPSDATATRVSRVADSLYDTAAAFIAIAALGEAIRNKPGQAYDQGDAVLRLASAAHDELIDLIDKLGDVGHG